MKKILYCACLLLAGGVVSANVASAISLVGWTGVGTSGTSGANGVVTLAPTGTQYGYVSTNNGVDIYGLDLGNETTGSYINSPAFSANAGDVLKFYFNFVTSDGSGYADYAWAQLLTSNDDIFATLFTARTTPGGDTVPGFGMPSAGAALVPSSTPIIGGAPAWDALGSSSGTCYSTGCGYTGWIEATYTVQTAGDYKLQIGTVNWTDSSYQTGIAFDGATIAGVDIGGQVPEPTTMLLFGTGLAGLAALVRRRA